MAAGTLSQEAFPYVNPPTDGAQAQRSAARAARANPAVSARTVQRGRNREKAGEAAGGLGAPKGRRLVIFIVGPVAYNEVRTDAGMPREWSPERKSGGWLPCACFGS